MVKKWFGRHFESALGAALMLVGGLLFVLALLAFLGDGGGSLVAGRLLALMPVLGLLLPFATLVDDDDGDDETAKTIVAMPAWMSEELQKEKVRIESERAAKAESADAPPAPVAPTPAVEEDPETARTMAFSPADAAAFREMTAPSSPPEAEAETTSAQTMAFSPAEASAFRENLSTAPTATPEPAPAPAPAHEEEDMGMAATVMFDAREAGFDKMVMPQTAQEEPAETVLDEMGEDETGAYSAQDVERLKDLMTKARTGQPQEEPDEAMASTMAYMPALSQEMAEARDESPIIEDEGGARTMAYMPAATEGNSTMAYSPEDKDRILAAMQAGKSPQEAMEEAMKSTQAYSPEQSAELREAFQMLDRVKAGAVGNAHLQAQAKELLANAHQADPSQLREQAQELLSKTGEMKVPTPRAAPSSAPVLTSDFGLEEKQGMGTVPLILILVLLLALAGGATAFILHFLGVIDLPVDLPQLDLFTKS
jgi:hypothetical protein